MPQYNNECANIPDHLARFLEDDISLTARSVKPRLARFQRSRRHLRAVHQRRTESELRFQRRLRLAKQRKRRRMRRLRRRHSRRLL